jgi:Tol biopolymer transport system component
MTSVFSRRGKVLAMVLASTGLMVGLLASGRAGQTKPPAPEAKPAAETKQEAKATGPGTLLLAREVDLVALTPDGKQGDELAAPKNTRSTLQGRLSPDGTRAAFVVSAARPAKAKGAPRAARPGDVLELAAVLPFQVVIRKLGSPEEKVVDFPGSGVDICWAPDGKRLAVTKFARDWSTETVLLDPQSGNTEPLELPAGVRLLDWARDGKTFLVTYRKDDKYRLGLAEKGDKEPRELTELKVRFPRNPGRFSPDGKKLLFTDADPEQKDAHKWHRSSQPHVLDIATKKRQPLVDFPANGQCLGVAWSPDGNRVAYTWTQLHAELLKKDSLNLDDVDILTKSFLMVADADGRNAKMVASETSSQARNPIYGSVDWR